jgi:hypothetical protein
LIGRGSGGFTSCCWRVSSRRDTASTVTTTIAPATEGGWRSAACAVHG